MPSILSILRNKSFWSNSCSSTERVLEGESCEKVETIETVRTTKTKQQTQKMQEHKKQQHTTEHAVYLQPKRILPDGEKVLQNELVDGFGWMRHEDTALEIGLLQKIR